MDLMPVACCAMRNSPPAPLPLMIRTGAPLFAATMMLVKGIWTTCCWPAGPPPRRTIYFVCFGSEERGGLGSRYFVDHSPVPLEKIVADITFEMLGRPDAKVPANTLWLTGYERSTLGPELTRQGARLVADPHPEQNFFQRSDNYTLALRGVVAHTVSSFGLHTDYHRVTDDLSNID